MRQASPRVSVLMAVHNGERFVRDAADSILRQSLPDFEFIVIDDGSTDRSAAVVTALADPRVRLISNETNLGLATSLNRGLAEARGEFIARIDADDTAHRHRLARQVAFLDTHADIALVGASFRTFGGGRLPSPAFWLPRAHHSLRFALLFYCPFIHSAVMWRREPVAREVGAYNPAFGYAMDWELWSRIADRFRVANLPDALVRYRTGDHSMTATHTGVVEEADAARRAGMRLVFGDAAVRDWSMRTKELHAIITGFEPGQAVPAAVDAVRQLQARYELQARLTGTELSVFRRELNGWLARRLVRAMEAARARGEHALATSLADAARSADGRVALTSRIGRYLLRFLNVKRSAPRQGNPQAP